MMARVSLAGALRSEAVRLRRSPLLWLHGVLAAALGGLAGAYFAFAAWDSLLGADAFFQLLGAGAPLLAGISCGLAADAEYRAGDGASLLGASSRRTALAAKLLVLLALGLLAAALAAALFCTALALAGRALPPAPSIALSVLGMALGSAALYMILFALALKFGRNLAVGVGALGFIAAITLLGGLANGLVSGSLSGATGLEVATAVPFAWPSRLATLPLETAIATQTGAPAQAQELAGAYAAVAVVCLVATALVAAVLLAGANRFEGRRTGD